MGFHFEKNTYFSLAGELRLADVDPITSILSPTAARRQHWEVGAGFWALFAVKTIPQPGRFALKLNQSLPARQATTTMNLRLQR